MIIEKILKVSPVIWMVGIAILIFFACSSFRHALFQSGAFDLGFFDNALYLISQGQRPFVVFNSIHILGDHAAYLLYILALLYKIVPDVHWLFAVQAVALALGAMPTFYLANEAGLNKAQAVAMAAVYLLYPLVFNVNLFDFHPEVMALPAILAAVLAARLGRIGWFCLCIIVILGCKAVLSLTVAAMGLWLLVFEKRRLYGAIALSAGVAWFLIATQVILPTFGVNQPTAVGRYTYLGNSLLEIVKNLLLQPEIVFSRIFTPVNFGYLLLLVSPVIWGLSPRYITPLLGAIPTLFLNLITDYRPQKDLIHHYSVPILPFLLLAVIANLAAGGGWLRSRRLIILWALVAFLALAKYNFFWSKYLSSLDNWQASREAIDYIRTQEGVLTTDAIAPHLTHRSVVKLVTKDLDSIDFSQVKYILLNVRHPGGDAPHKSVKTLFYRLKQTPEFQIIYERDHVFLFEPQPPRIPLPRVAF